MAPTVLETFDLRGRVVVSADMTKVPDITSMLATLDRELGRIDFLAGNLAMNAGGSRA